MVLVSNQLIRRLELSPSWYQLILSRRKKGVEPGLQLINFQCSSTGIHCRLSANHCHSINSPLIRQREKGPLIGCRGNFSQRKLAGIKKRTSGKDGRITPPMTEMFLITTHLCLHHFHFSLHLLPSPPYRHFERDKST